MEKRKRIKGKRNRKGIGEKKIFGKTITKKQSMDIFSGKGAFIRGLKNQKGDNFDAYVRLKEGNLDVFLFLP